VVIQRAKIDEVAIRLLEVVAQDLREFRPPLVGAVHLVDPVHESLVE
jgi:hypothetical protein